MCTPILRQLILELLEGEFQSCADRSVSFWADIHLRQSGFCEWSKLFEHAEIVSHADGRGVNLSQSKSLGIYRFKECLNRLFHICESLPPHTV